MLPSFGTPHIYTSFLTMDNINFNFISFFTVPYCTATLWDKIHFLISKVAQHQTFSGKASFQTYLLLYLLRPMLNPK